MDWTIRSADLEAEQGEEVTKCPQCREQTPRAEVQLVHYTATQQWDELLEIAQQWAKMDRRRADETSEEEDEEEFIDDNTRYITHSTKLHGHRLNECIILVRLYCQMHPTHPEAALRSQTWL